VTGTAASTSEDGPPRSGVEVRLARLVRRDGPVVALDGLDLTLAPGALVALLGPSSCGRTTAMRLLAGLEDADSGRVVVGGKDVPARPTAHTVGARVQLTLRRDPVLVTATSVDR